MLKTLCVLLPFSIVVIFGCASVTDNSKHTEQKSVEEIIPVTMANLRGHQSLYKEGWFVITSSEQALNYAREKSIISSRQALHSAAQSIAARNKDFSEKLQTHWQGSLSLGKQTFETGTEISETILEASKKLSTQQIQWGKAGLEESMQRFIKGYMYLGERTENTRETLASQPGDYFTHLKKDFSNIYNLSEKIQKEYSAEINDTWDSAFQEAANSFNEEYEKSGESSNSLDGLLHILQGYAKGLYHGLLKPTAITGKETVSAGARRGAQIVFLPTATSISVTGRTIEAIGTTVFYTGKLGVEIVSPTVEAGLLSGMSMLSLASAPLTYVTGTAVGAVNQVAFTAATPVATTGSAALRSTAETGKHVAFITYDAIAGTSKVVINQTSSAMVLGYNALSALPAHLFMGAVDSAVFLAWDGPKLVIAYAKGEIKNSDADSLPIDTLPVGSVVDLKNIQTEGVEVEILTDDPAVINKVLEQIPNDLHE